MDRPTGDQHQQRLAEILRAQAERPTLLRPGGEHPAFKAEQKETK